MFSVGKYNGDEYSIADLDAMVTAYQELKGRLDPPLKLGHNEKQAFAKEFERDDGKPAMGWVENLRRVGKKLVADFVQVPEQVADWVKEGRYKKKSAEIYWGFKDGGKAYSRVLKAVALLGADIPANRDIASLQYDYQGNEYRVAEYAEEAEPYAKVDDLPPEVKAQLDDDARKVWMDGHNAVCGMMDRWQASDVAWQAVRKAGYGPKVEKWVKYAELSTAAINDLPDAAFAAIMPGGKKDEGGKTVPRSLRMLPHHTAGVTSPTDNESVDLPHLRNALARLKQADMPAAMMRRAMSHLEAHAKALRVGEREMAEINQTIKEVTQHMNELEELTRKYTEMESKNAELAGQVKAFAEKLSAVEAKAGGAEAARTKAEGDAKSYAERLAATEKSLADEKKARRLSELRSVAAAFPHIPGTVEEKADKLYRLESVDAKFYDERVAEWRALNEQIGNSDLFSQHSYSGERPGSSSAKDRMDAAISEALKQGRAKTLPEATALVCQEQPRLYSEYQREHEARARHYA